MAACIELDALESRVNSLEKRIFGNQDPSANYPEVADFLVNFSSRLGNVISGRDRVESVLKKVDDLERYLCPWAGDSSTVPNPIQLELILSQEGRLQRNVAQLEELEESKTVLNSRHIQDVPTMITKLEQLSSLQREQEENYQQLVMETRNVISNYKQIMAAINNTLIEWNKILSVVEKSHVVDEK